MAILTRDFWCEFLDPLRCEAKLFTALQKQTEVSIIYAELCRYIHAAMYIFDALLTIFKRLRCRRDDFWYSQAGHYER